MFSEITSKTLKTYIDASPIPLTLASPVFDDCPIILCNGPFLELTGYARDDVIGRNCRFLQGRNTDPKMRGRLRAAIEQRTEALVQITNYRRDGSEFENIVFLMPIFDAAGELLYVLGSQCDVTTQLRKITPIEHAQLLESGIEVARPQLVSDERLRLLERAPLTQSLRAALTSEMFE